MSMKVMSLWRRLFGANFNWLIHKQHGNLTFSPYHIEVAKYWYSYLHPGNWWDFAWESLPRPVTYSTKGMCPFWHVFLFFFFFFFSLSVDWPWPLRHILCNFTKRLLLIWTPKTNISDTVDEAVMKINKKIKIGIHGYIICYNFQSIVNLKLNFWDYNEKYTGFHLTHKKYYFRLRRGDENTMGTSYFKRSHNNLRIKSGLTDAFAWGLCIATL